MSTFVGGTIHKSGNSLAHMKAEVKKSLSSTLKEKVLLILS